MPRLSAAVVGILVTAACAGRPPVSPEQPRAVSLDGARKLLAPDELVFLGHYRINRNLRHEMNWGQGLALRRVNGQLRLLTLSFKGHRVPRPESSFALVEVELPATFGETVTTVTGLWNDIWQGAGTMAGRGAQTWMGIGFGPDGRFYSVSAIDYPGSDNGASPSIYARTLVEDGSITALQGPLGLGGMSPRLHAGAIFSVPAWFQKQASVGPLAFSGGGYMSRMCSASSPSMGPTLFIAPDLTERSGQVRVTTLMNHVRATCAEPWYPGGSRPSGYDRGHRNDRVRSEFRDRWTSPAPDGVGRWTWGDSIWGSMMWVDTPSRTGVVAVLTQVEGRAWYQRSNTHYEAQSAELHIYDPALLAKVAAGQLGAWQVRPVRAPLTLPGFYVGNIHGGGPFRAVAGAVFDAVDKRIYLYVPWVVEAGNVAAGRIYVYGMPGDTS